MSTYETLLVRTDKRGVARLQLDRPDRRNALSGVMIAELQDFARGLHATDAPRAVVIEGAGKVFCAGGDLRWMLDQIDADRATRMAQGRKLAEMLAALNEVPVPLIARIHGGAFGGGIGIACVCDAVVAEEGARFGLTETRLGLIPATIGPYVIARLGEGAARRVFMSSRVFGADEAKDLGIVSEVVPADALDAAVEAQVAPYLATSPEAVASAKALARALGPPITSEIIERTIERLADTWESADAREGIEAFLAKRPPRWTVE